MEPPRNSTSDLAALALEGQSTAWDELVRRHTHRVVVALLARGVGLDQAEDLVQETWLRLIQQQRAGRLTRLELPGLAIAQARWLACEAARTGARRTALAGLPLALDAVAGDRQPADVLMDPEHLAIQRERLERVRREVERCGARARGVFAAVYERSLSHTEAAQEYCLSVQRVRQILCEIRARVRAALREIEGDPEP